MSTITTINVLQALVNTIKLERERGNSKAGGKMITTCTWYECIPEETQGNPLKNYYQHEESFRKDDSWVQN